MPQISSWTAPVPLILVESSTLASRDARSVLGRRLIVIHDRDERELIEEIAAYRGYVISENDAIAGQLSFLAHIAVAAIVGSMLGAIVAVIRR